ncbi:MAG: PQQ-binding-like beta-propeller repeat protein [Acidimicrobiales bacterium]|nr:PQQ-binding-like beta-propeller repeat protein [Acidimicrobiales bacterium]
MRFAAIGLAVAVVILGVGVAINDGSGPQTSLGNDDTSATTTPQRLSVGDDDDSSDTSPDTDGWMATTSTVAPQPSELSERPSVGDSPTSTTIGATPTTQAPTPRFTGPGVDAVTYQLNAAHTGGHIDPDLPDDIKLLWKRDLNASMSFPLIVGERIFAVGAPFSDTGGANPPIRLYAFDRRTGTDAWPSVEIGGGRSGFPMLYAFTAGLAYDSGRIYVVNYDGEVRAFNPATGDEMWSTTLPGIDAAGNNGVTSTPTAKNGHVYVVSPSKVFALAEGDGRILTRTVPGGGVKSSPAVSNDGVYVSVGAIDVYKLSPADGTPLWHMHAGDTAVAGGTTPVLFGDRLYARLGVPGYNDALGLSFPGDARVLDAATGAQQSNMRSVFTPAFRAGIGLFVDDNRVVAGRDLATDEVLWTYPEAEAAPLIVNDSVFLQSGDRRLVRLDLHSGEVKFSSAPDLVEGWPDENAPQWMQRGISEGRGVVAATSGMGLVVFG